MKRNEKIIASAKAILALTSSIADYNLQEFGYSCESDYQSDYSQYQYYGWNTDELGPGPDNFMVRLLDANGKFLVQNWSCNADQGYSMRALWGGPLPKGLLEIDSNENVLSHFIWDNIEHLKKARFIVVLDLYDPDHKVAGHRARHERGQLFQILNNGQVRYVGPWKERVFLLGDPYFNKDGWFCARDEAARAALEEGTYDGRRPSRRREPVTRRRRGTATV
ncbi:MAG: hypothetical protein VZR64_00320 [Eubacterium sp.]|nr:hypothetical protein [Eubacterium sp.]